MDKKIGLISDHASPLALLGSVDCGGQNVYVDKLARQLGKLGYKVDVFTRHDNTNIQKIVKLSKNVRVINLKAGPVKEVAKEKLLPYMDEFKESLVQFMETENIRYDLFHANFFMSAYVAAEIKKSHNIPFVVTYHALGKVRQLHQKEADKFPADRNRIEEQVAKEANHIIAECPQDKDDLIKLYGAKESKITIVPCGFDPKELYPKDKKATRKSLGFKKDEKIILVLGRLVKRKGVDNVIRAIPAIKEMYKQPFKLVIVGGESKKPDPKLTPEIARLTSLAKKLGVEKDIVFVGKKSRDEIKHYYNSANVFVSTPWYEPFGITPVESMACKTPVIGSYVGGIKFTVVDNKTGFLVPPHDPKTLSEKISKVLGNETLQEQLGQKGLERVTNLFTWRSISISIARLYEKSLTQTVKKTDSEKTFYKGNAYGELLRQPD